MVTHTVAMAKATTQDIDTMWKLFYAVQAAGDHRNSEERVKTLIAGRALQLGEGGISRILMGYGVMLDHFCDQGSDIIEYSNELHGKLEALEVHQKDLEAAAGELMVDIPEPGTVIARLLRANSLMRKERDQAKSDLIDLKEAFYGNKN